MAKISNAQVVPRAFGKSKRKFVADHESFVCGFSSPRNFLKSHTDSSYILDGQQ